jgi:hypothetical protein
MPSEAAHRHSRSPSLPVAVRIPLIARECTRLIARCSRGVLVSALRKGGFVVDHVDSQSRRSLLAGALGGIGVALATLGRARSASAADGEPLLLGESNEASTRTIVTSDVAGTSESTLEVITAGVSASGIHARSDGGAGIRAEGGHGVIGGSSSSQGVGVLGEDLTISSIGRGVQGISHNGWACTR